MSGDKNHTYRVSDMSIAAWFYMNGLEFAEKPSGHGQTFVAIFLDPKNSAEDLITSFANSEASRFDQAVRTLKKLVSRSLGPT
jgi:hypothetical protein